MEALRKIYRQLPDTLKMPKSLQQRRVEVILLPLDAEKSERTNSNTGISPLSRFAGAWTGDQLERGDQGTYEIREEFN
jgi:hypothetical protein